MPARVNNTESPDTSMMNCSVDTVEVETTDCMRFTVRPIRTQDVRLLADFHRQLSEESVYRRYFSPLKLETRVAHNRLLRRCRVDEREQVALVAEHQDTAGAPHIAAVARLIRMPGQNSAELAFVVADLYQHRGLGKYLLSRMIATGRELDVKQLEAEVLAENEAMKHLFRAAGFVLSAPEAGVLSAHLAL
jgi:acetyltransferase